MSTTKPPKMMLSFNSVFPANVKAFFLDREIDFAYPKDGHYLTQAQKTFLKDKLDIDGKNVASIKQVHQDMVAIVNENFIEARNVPEADAAVTNLDNVVLTVRTADCLPIFLYDPKQDCIGLVHAGWKSTAKNIAAKTANKMKEIYGANPKDLKAAFGPCMHKCCFEVSEDLRRHFPKEVISRSGKYFLDLALVNKNQLIGAGISKENIFDCNECTFCGKNYFSYRREGKDTGRMLSLMMKTK